MVGGANYSAWDLLWSTLVVLWMLVRVLWPVLLLALGGKLLLAWLERRMDRRRIGLERRRRRRSRRPAHAPIRVEYAPTPVAAQPPAPPPPIAGSGYPPDWDMLRREVYRRAGYRCQNCGRGNVELHAHHIVPLSADGTNALTNLACLCRHCHEAIHPHMRTEMRYAAPQPGADAVEFSSDAKLRW